MSSQWTTAIYSVIRGQLQSTVSPEGTCSLQCHQSGNLVSSHQPELLPPRGRVWHLEPNVNQDVRKNTALCLKKKAPDQTMAWQANVERELQHMWQANKSSDTVKFENTQTAFWIMWNQEKFNFMEMHYTAKYIAILLPLGYTRERKNRHHPCIQDQPYLGIVNRTRNKFLLTMYTSHEQPVILMQEHSTPPGQCLKWPLSNNQFQMAMVLWKAVPTKDSWNVAGNLHQTWRLVHFNYLSESPASCHRSLLPVQAREHNPAVWEVFRNCNRSTQFL